MTYDEANSFMVYTAETGVLTWRVPRGNRRSGQTIGTPDTHGHLRFKHMGRTYAVHRISWLLTFGEWPIGEIDHINGIRSDNRIINLRQVTRRENSENRHRSHKNNGLGVLGVRQVGSQFQARITVRGKQMSIGMFSTLEAAKNAYLTAKRQLHDGCTI